MTSLGTFTRIWAAAALGSVLAGAPPAAVPVQASEINADAASKARHRINIAGRQRMLTQRMSKSVCLSLPEADPAPWNEQAFLAAEEFETTLAHLINGSPDGQVDAADAASEKAALEEVAALSGSFTAAVKQVASRDLHSVPMNLILARNMPVMEQMDAAVEEMERLLGGSDLDAAVASTINQAGRQRMLSQKIAKELCFTTFDLETEKARKTLRDSASLFSAVLDGLRKGNTFLDLLPPPTPLIAEKLARVQAHWDAILPVIEKVASGGQIDEAQLFETVATADLLLVEMNDVVGLWAAHSG